MGEFRSFHKQGQIKKEGAAYLLFKNDLHELDNWRCVRCRQIKQLTVHHVIKRSAQRLDTFENCVSLCLWCHEAAERREFTVEVRSALTPRVVICVESKNRVKSWR